MLLGVRGWSSAGRYWDPRPFEHGLCLLFYFTPFQSHSNSKGMFVTRALGHKHPGPLTILCPHCCAVLGECLHIPCNKSLGLTRTATFTSIHSHLGLELGRWDDLESLVYILIYFLHGSLPWQGLKCGVDDQVFKRKQGMSAHKLCHGLPAELNSFLDYVCSLYFNDKPNYGFLECLFMLLVGSQYDLVFNWDVLA